MSCILAVMWKSCLSWIIFCLPISCAWKELKSSTFELVYVQVVTTPGSFAPLELYPTSENSEDDWLYGFGQPTKLGKKQEYELGKDLRLRYDNFITTDPSEVEVFSAAEDRAVLGVLGLTASLYAPRPEWQFAPGFNWQPIPISHEHQGDKFFYYEDFCHNMYHDRMEIIRSPFAHNLTERNKGLYYYLHRKSGKSIGGMFDVADLFDILEKERIEKLNVPSWATTYWDEMKTITDEAYGLKYNSTVSQLLKIGSLMDLVISRMRVKTPDFDPSPKVRVSVYMTHNWNMAAILQVMRYFSGRPPPCTSLVFELYSKKEEMFARMLLFNSTNPELGSQIPTVILLDGCEEYCPIMTLANFFKHIVPDNFWKECDSKEMELDGSSF